MVLEKIEAVFSSEISVTTYGTGVLKPRDHKHKYSPP
jgi:hypothetical protein